MSILQRIVEVKKREVDCLRKSMPLEELKERISRLPGCRDFKTAITSGTRSIIAEVKKHSPSKGSMNEVIDPMQIAMLYERNGASAISVLTDHEFFHGSAKYLMDVRKAVTVPVLRKDFLIDAYQIYETRLMEADAVLSDPLGIRIRMWLTVSRSRYFVRSMPSWCAITYVASSVDIGP